MPPLNRYVCDRGRQCGAIGLLAAITLALAALCMLVVVDSGRLFLEKRSLQRIAAPLRSTPTVAESSPQTPARPKPFKSRSAAPCHAALRQALGRCSTRHRYR